MIWSQEETKSNMFRKHCKYTNLKKNKEKLTWFEFYVVPLALKQAIF